MYFLNGFRVQIIHYTRNATFHTRFGKHKRKHQRETLAAMLLNVPKLAGAGRSRRLSNVRFRRNALGSKQVIRLCYYKNHELVPSEYILPLTIA